MRVQTDPLTLYRQWQQAPYQADFFHALRRLECLFPDKPRLGCAARPQDEPVRIGQEPSLRFAPATISSFQLPEGTRPARMEVQFMGLFGPGGPLPLHLTEYARERLLHAGDASFARFADVFHHRFFLLFYRAWAQAQPAIHLDRPKADRFAAYSGSLFGLGSPAVQHRDGLGDHAKLFFAGHLARQVRNPDGLAQALSAYFGLAVRIEPFVGHWIELDKADRTRLGRTARLGHGAVAGERVWDRQHKFRLHLGPLTLTQYQSFLPGGGALPRLIDWVRQYLGIELEWDVHLSMQPGQVHTASPGRFGRLGWTSWLGSKKPRQSTGELILNPEQRARARLETSTAPT